MVALLAFLGSVIELVEIPTVVWLVVTLLKVRKENERLRKAVKETLYTAGITSESI